jgi:glycosyltransferase involved in cell wall biosynthesis
MNSQRALIAPAGCGWTTSGDRPLRIAHLTFSALPRTVGGLEIVVDSLIRNQAEAGHAVTLVTRWKQYRAFRGAGFPYPALSLPPNLRFYTDPLGPVGPRWPVAAAVRWHQWRHRFDIWHIHWLFPTGWMAHDALVRAGVPVVLTAHGADIEVERTTRYGFRLNSEHDRRVRAMVPRVACLTAISASVESIYLELGAAREHIHRIPNGVDARRIADSDADVSLERRRLGIPPDANVVISVGRNEPRKGFQYIPEMLAHLLKHGRNIVWIVIGAKSDELRPIAEEHGTLAAMRLLPPVGGGPNPAREFPPPSLVRLYRSADVFAFPSMMESFGLVALEAMAAGLPVVVNDVPGLRDVVSDDVDGLLCRAGDPASMAESIGRVLDDADLRNRLVANGRRKSMAHDWTSIASQYLDLYRELITGTAR